MQTGWPRWSSPDGGGLRQPRARAAPRDCPRTGRSRPCMLDLDSISMADRTATAASDATRRWRHEALNRRFGYAAAAAVEVSWRRLRRGGGAGGISPPELFPSRRRKGATAADISSPNLGRGGRLQLDDLRLASSLAHLSPPSLMVDGTRGGRGRGCLPLSLPIGQATGGAPRAGAWRWVLLVVAVGRE
jgi:hypothetical protein